MANIDDLTVKISADVSGLNKGVNEAKNSLSKLDDKKALSGLSGAFGDAFKSASSLQGGLGTLGSAVGALVNPVTLVVAGVTALAAGFVNLVSESSKVAKEFETNKFAIASLLNTTLQFKDEAGKPLEFGKNFEQSLNQADSLIIQLQKDAAELAGVEFTDLVDGLKTAAPYLAQMGVVDVKGQARAVSLLASAFAAIKPQASEMEKAVEIRTILSGDFGKGQSELARFLKGQGASTEALKAEFAAAQQAGTGLEFLESKFGTLVKGIEQASDTLLNQEQVLRQNVTLAFLQVGQSVNEVFKNIVKDVSSAFEGFNFNDIGNNFASIIQSVQPLIKPLVTGFLELIEALSGIGAIVANAFNPLIQLLGAAFEGAVELSKPFVEIINLIAELYGVGSDFFGFLIESFGVSLDEVGKFIKGFIDGFASGIENVTNFIRGFRENWAVNMQFLREAFNASMSNIFLDFQKLLGNLLVAFGRFVAKINKDIGDVISNVGNQLKLDAVIKKENLKPLLSAQEKKLQQIVNVGAGLKQQKGVFSAAPKFTPLATDSGTGGSDKKGEADRAKKESERQAKEKQREAEKLASLQQQLQIEQQIFSLKQKEQTQLGALDTAQQLNSFQIQDLELEKQSIELAGQKAGKLTEQQQSRLQAINTQVAELNVQNQLLALESQIAEAKNQKVLKEEEYRAKLQEIQLQLEQGKLTEQQANIERELAKVKNDEYNLSIDATIQKRQAELDHLNSIKGKIVENAEVQGQTTKACGKTQDAFGKLKEAAQQVGETLGNSIGEAIKTGEFDLKSLASSMIDIFFGVASSFLSSFAGGLGGGGGGFNLFGNKDGGLIGHYASGGFVSGSGTSRSDSIPAMLSNGEFVINAKAVKSLGLGKLNMLNNGILPKFAFGGLVTPTNVPAPKRGMIGLGIGSIDSQGRGIVNIHITAMDSQDTLRALQKPEVQKYIGNVGQRSVSQGSARVFNSSPMQYQRNK